MKSEIVAVASDHAGFEQKKQLVKWMLVCGVEVHDLGPYDNQSVDYPDYAVLVAREVSEEVAQKGVLICGTGIGMAITANKFRGIRAANAVTPQFAELARAHNDANILAISGRFVDVETNKEILRSFFNTRFAGERHSGRVEKISATEQAIIG